MSDTPRVAVVAGSRTPFAKAGAHLRKHRALDLGVHAVDGLLDKADIDPGIVDTLVFGIVVVDARVPHLAREVNFQSRLPDSTRSLTITDNCITAASGIELVVDSIKAGRAEVGIAGGVESMSNPSVLMSRKASAVFLQAAAARSLPDRLKIFARLRPKDLVPQAPGVAEPSTGLSMGEHCELMVKEWKISREEQDEIAYRSHMNAAAATADGRLPAEIVPLDGIERDTMVRADTSMEQLAKLRTVFDPTPAGTLTAGNSSPLTDGAAAVMLMSEDRARAESLQPLAFVRDMEFVGIDPADGLLMGPGVAVPR
ncbi:MAG: acetyl-CoA C-acyltransferase, partial [Acidimicrobiia bacterium]|nr:acetyl-CoA C-acyltransferase [Acidimicrobiia bacterium]